MKILISICCLAASLLASMSFAEDCVANGVDGAYEVSGISMANNQVSFNVEFTAGVPHNYSFDFHAGKTEGSITDYSGTNFFMTHDAMRDSFEMTATISPNSLLVPAKQVEIHDVTCIRL